MKGRRAIKFRQLLAVIGSTMIVAIISVFYEHFTLLTPNVEKLSPTYSFWFSLEGATIGSFILGTLIGLFLVYYMQDRFSDKPYGYTIILLLLMAFSAALVVSIIFLVPYAMLLTGKPFSDPATLSVFNDLLFHKVNPVFFIIIPLIVVQQLMLQIFNKFGPGIFWKIVKGTYNRPKIENRIFMFVDLNDSTSIAEKLSEERYHEFLKNYYADITVPILDHEGEIYQYLGDGIILAWNYRGNADDQHCVDCFFDMKKEIELKQEKYREKFGIVPAFKAGIHCGRVVVGEIGIIKRDITYSGDVMNTSSRIQSMCKELKSELLLSNELIRSFPPNSSYEIKSVGSIQLKGKEKGMELSSVAMK